ncbi:MAG: hypothetical protein ACREOK_05550 [Gemmatimonadaceae bacterium]
MTRQIMTTVAVLCVVVACARLPGVSKGDRAVRAQADSIVVDVLNENYYDARIHAVYDGGQRRSLGTIAGNGGHAQVALSWEPRSLVFEVLFVTVGETYVTLPVDVVPEQSIDLRVPSNIGESGFFRRLRRN